MCGVIGVNFPEVRERELKFIERLFTESQIRGKHATGISYVSEGRLMTHKSAKCAEEFLQDFDIKKCMAQDGSITFIAHTRYSTSDLRYNQPLSDENRSIVHNGVISQESKENWIYETETSNDSELVLKSFHYDRHPFVDFHPSSMAVIVLEKDRTIHAFRNEARPLHYTYLYGGVAFASTENILLRSGANDSCECDMYKVYRTNPNTPLSLMIEWDYVGMYPDVEDLQ